MDTEIEKPYCRPWYQTHREQQTAYAKVYYQTHRKQILANRKVYYQKNRREYLLRKINYHKQLKLKIFRHYSKDVPKCIKCGICYIFCPEGCIGQNKKGHFEADLYYCKGCGICASACPRKAITLQNYSDEQVTAKTAVLCEA